MVSYTVKQVSNMLGTNEETVRRWIRSGKLDASWTSKKEGNVISSSSLYKFINDNPKYATAITSSMLTSPAAMSVVMGGLLGTMLTLLDNSSESKVSPWDVELFIRKKINSHEKNLRSKKVELSKIQADIYTEEKEIEKYKYALENLDFKIIADEINNENEKDRKRNNLPKSKNRN